MFVGNMKNGRSIFERPIPPLIFAILVMALLVAYFSYVLLQNKLGWRVTGIMVLLLAYGLLATYIRLVLGPGGTRAKGAAEDRCPECGTEVKPPVENGSAQDKPPV